MKTRLEALLRQRELIREHLKWLESEIAGVESASSAVARAPSAHAKVETPSVESSVTASEFLPADVPAEVDVRSIHSEVRAGCVVYGAIAATLLAALLGFIYWKY